jgi:hypothetical protein
VEVVECIPRGLAFGVGLLDVEARDGGQPLHHPEGLALDGDVKQRVAGLGVVPTQRGGAFFLVAMGPDTRHATAKLQLCEHGGKGDSHSVCGSSAFYVDEPLWPEGVDGAWIRFLVDPEPHPMEASSRVNPQTQ